MPKASRTKLRQHAPAAQMPFKRSFAASEVNEQMLPASTEAEPLSSELPVASTSTAGASRKRGFIVPQPVLPAELLSHPYSRSHTRREKRKAKQNLHGGTLDVVAEALGQTMDDDSDEAPDKPVKQASKAPGSGKNNAKTTAAMDGRIGEGRGKTMREKARRKQIKIEGMRIPAIMQHPEYKKDPWATIRLHAANTLEPVTGGPTGSRF